jgi:hypothetical protein
MDHTQIEELARAIAQRSVLDAWPYWLTLIALVFLGVVVANFLASYFAKRGEVSAARADREEILTGLRATTKAAEEVKSAVSLGEWTERERRSLRRAKLEELLLLAYKTQFWLESERIRLVFTLDDGDEPSPKPTMMAIGGLYFPELEEPLRAYSLACNKHYIALLEARQRVTEVGMEHPAVHVSTQAMMELRGALNGPLGESYGTILAPLSALHHAAAALMATITASPE